MSLPIVIRQTKAEKSNTAGDLFDGNTSAVIVEQAFSASECEQIIAAVQQSELVQPLFPKFLLYGGMLMFSQTKQLYFDRDQRLQTALDGHSVWKKLVQVFANLGVLASPFRFPEGKTAAPFNIRELQQGGDIAVHSEHTRWPWMEELAQTLDFSTQLSFYLQLKPAQHGGKLELVGATPNGQSWSRTEPLTLTLQQGDFILFDGGRINHRVSQNTGPTSRWTLGGFASVRAERIYVWG